MNTQHAITLIGLTLWVAYTTPTEAKPITVTKHDLTDSALPAGWGEIGGAAPKHVSDTLSVAAHVAEHGITTTPSKYKRTAVSSGLKVPPARAASKPFLPKLTEKFIATQVQKNKSAIATLDKANDEAKLPPDTLSAMWFIESMAGTLNVRNKSGYAGHFQLGSYESGRYCKGGSPYNLKDAATCTINLLHDYSEKSGVPLDSSANAYGLHQQGFDGFKRIHNQGYVTPKILRNIRANLPPELKSRYFKGGKLTGSVLSLMQDYKFNYSREITRIQEIIREYK